MTRVIQQPFHFVYLLELLNVGNKMKKLNTQEFVERARLIHGDKYDYSKVNYVNRRVKVMIGCPIHGFRLQYPEVHLNGCGCRLCGIEKGAKMRTLTKEDFVAKARIVHGDYYTYDKVVYVNSRTQVKITCPIHGDFEQAPSSHLFGQGCPLCGLAKISQKKSLTQEQVIELFKQSHPEDNYDYSKVLYVGSTVPVEIICPIHGSFFQTPVTHIHGSHGCPACGYSKIGINERKGRESFVKEASKIHNNKYSYELVPEHFLTSDKIPIICPEHGVFNQIVNNHLRGSGCPHCPKTTISRGEDMLCEVLNGLKIDYIPQYRISDNKLLGETKSVIVDIYIPSQKAFIEYNGEQHYRPVKHFGGVEKFKYQQYRDNALRLFCKENGIKLIEIPYLDFDEIENIIKKELKIK